MGSCCPGAPAELQAGAADTVTDIQDNQPVRGETPECFMATANNPTGKHNDATENVPNKIENNSIPLDAQAKVDVTFRMQLVDASTPGLRVPTSWTLKDADTGAAWVNSTVTFTSSGATAKLVGTFAGTDLGKTFKLVLAALDGTGEIDNRGFNFAPAKSTGSDSIQFIHPLPGSVVTSRFSLARLHPVDKIVKPHGGCDFAYAGGRISEVVAGADGVVVFTGFEAKGAGNYVKIKHVNSSGNHLCTSVYMHLAKILVAEGQQVQAGQKIGVEGNTGHGSGAHLHFECRLPNNTKIDPEPLIRGSLDVARSTNPDNSAVQSSIETKTNNAVLTPENVKARTTCAAFGPDYPNKQTPVPAPVMAPGSTDPFELAWALTMNTEVIGWLNTPPTVPDTLQGLIDTAIQRRNVGYVDHPADPGGVTKFGIAQRFNKGISVPTAKYEDARNIGYSSFWNGKLPGNLVSSKPKTAVAIFNIGFLCGLGGAKTILDRANISALSDADAVDSVCDSMKNYLLGKVAASPGKAAFKNGWLRRVETVRSYCKALNI
jgi:murein DD-endopeptidase MepM/ murein hydrolase activator NlpD